MGIIRKRAAAKRDLISQWVWYAENADIETADRFLSTASETAAMLARQPEAGYRFFVRRPELQGMRRFPLANGFEKILLFYFPLQHGIELVRVVHGSRELERLLIEGFSG
ncbi:MAG: type II toxin-antitoxin system RelE/ParE family toxin [Bryobacter sp.]|jgi:toxin ParE1/3/4|nr:type II toxin-antitoxin system RelE/ParE family toxin [Bryobacter sp. CoA8 C33]